VQACSNNFEQTPSFIIEGEAHLMGNQVLVIQMTCRVTLCEFIAHDKYIYIAQTFVLRDGVSQARDRALNGISTIYLGFYNKVNMEAILYLQ
jgi:hypothetical protein